MNLGNYLNFEKLLPLREEVKKIFFYRVCGTGMGATACLLKEAGYQVEGCDIKFYPPMGTYLKDMGLNLFSMDDFSKDQLKNYDLIVVGNVVPRNSQDARDIEDSGVPFCSFPAILGAFILKDRKVMGISGTHGKTTTTYFMTQLFEAMGEKPGYFIGGVMEGRPSSFLGSSDYFFIESDEYDSAYFEKYSKFMSYDIDDLIITSLEFDHADIYSSLDEILSQFDSLIEKMNGKIIACADYPAIHQLKEKYGNKEWFLYGKESKLGPVIHTANEAGTRFEVDGIDLETNMVGEHNIYNIGACVLYALKCGFSKEEIQKAVKKLSLVKRRQEVRGILGDTLVIDDFAHHPRAVQLTLDSLKIRYPDRRLFVIFEPVSATARSDVFQNEFAKSLSIGDQIGLVKPPAATSAKGRSDIDYDLMIGIIGENSRRLDSLDEIQQFIDEASQTKSLTVVLSNGTCMGLWESDFPSKLEKFPST